MAPKPEDWYVSQIHREESLLADPLRRHGLSVLRADWADPSIDWSRVRCAVLRSTWDYFERFPEFSAWLEQVSARTRLINDARLVRWNIDKHYLADLARAGVEVVPTRYVEQGEKADLVELAGACGWEAIVVKPAVSGAARLTFRASGREEIAALQPTFDRCAAAEAMLVQPFLPEITTQGELSLIVIGGKTTHAIRKTAKAGDFRVQDDHGGTAHPYEPSGAEIAFAEKAVAACPMEPLYARVDFVMAPDGPRLMELELIEPELFFRFCPSSAERLAESVAGVLNGAAASPTT